MYVRMLSSQVTFDRCGCYTHVSSSQNGLDTYSINQCSVFSPVSPLCVEYSFNTAEYSTPAEFCCPTVRKFTVRAPKHTTHLRPLSSGGSFSIWNPSASCFLSSTAGMTSHVSTGFVLCISAANAVCYRKRRKLSFKQSCQAFP